MRLTLLVSIFFYPVICFGQYINNDVDVKRNAVEDSISVRMSDADTPHNSFSYINGLLHGLDKQFIPSYPSYFKRPMFFETIRAPKDIYEPGNAYIPLWNDGGLAAKGSETVMPGLMKIDSGEFGFRQSIGNVSFYFGGVANKYGFFNGLHTQYGVSGNFRYNISSNLSFTAFGTYYFGKPIGMPLLPAMVGYYKVSTFGGYFSHQFNETFGVDVGAQTVQQFGSNKYQLEPIVTPTVKVGKVKFGLPVGQILNGIIRTRTEHRK